MRFALVLLLGLVLAVPAVAAASWGPARTFSAAHASSAQPAVNGRGDVVLLWRGRSSSRVRMTLVPARGRIVTRRSPSGLGPAVLDERGRVTVAWSAGTKLFAAHGSPTGTWAAPQLIARHAFGPVLAVSPQGRVLLAWTNLAGSTGVAWRAPGHGFSRPVTLRRPAPQLRPGNSPVSDLGAAFDARGRAYLWGTCDGIVRVAGPRSRHLGLVAVAPGRALGFSLSVVGDGSGVASWIDSQCSSDAAAGPEPGSLTVRLLRAGAFAAPLTLGTATSSTHAFALAGAGSLISGTAFENWMLWTLDAQGALQSTATRPTPDPMPLSVDAAGDVLFTAAFAGIVVHRSDGADERFPYGYAGGSAVAPNARRFAGVSDPDLTLGANPHPTSPRRRLTVSVWRP